LLLAGLLPVSALSLQPAVAADKGHQQTPGALRLLAREAQDDDAGAQLLYALAYLEGRNGLQIDTKKAIYWLRRSARLGNAYAQLKLGNVFAQGNGIEKDLPHAIKWWRKASLKGNPQAQYQLGKALLNGQGTAKNTTQAIHWLTKSAEQNNKDAQFLLGKMYTEGYNVTKDESIAKDWLSRAAELGSTEAISLMTMLRDSVGFTTKIYKESAEALKKRAENGDTQAEYELGIRYESGAWDVEQSNKLALAWITKAAEHGHRIAMLTLADIYYHGDLGTSVDQKKSAQWRKKAQALQR